jgi:hypothetical protein
MAKVIGQQEVHDAYQALYETLNDAYWAASTIEAKDRLHGLAESVFDIVTDLNRAEIKKRTAEYQATAKQVTAVSDKLATLKTDIRQLIHRVEVAGQVANAIDQAIRLASKFFV